MSLATAVAAAASLVLTGHCTVDTAGAFAARANAPPPTEGGDDNAIAMSRSQREHEVIVEHRRSSSDACSEK
jgi:hypothetical protein